MTKLGIVWMPRSAREARDVAAATEAAGFWALGLCDSPVLYTEVYQVVTDCLLHTTSLVVGPNVTNPVTRHWTVHAAALRTFAELHPERYYLGLGAGDGAVHAVDLAPADWPRIVDATRRIREAAPDTGPIHLAAGGPRGARAAGPVCDAVILGTGADVDALRGLAAEAQQARADAGLPGRVETWGLVALNVVEDPTEITRAREELSTVALAYARHALSATFAGKNVPTEYQQPLVERFAQYRFLDHARLDEGNPNAHLLDDVPEIRDYVIDRFSISGTADQCRARVQDLIERTELDGIWFTVTVPQPVTDIRRAGAALGGLSDVVQSV